MREVVTKRFKDYREYLNWKEIFADIREVSFNINEVGQVTIKYLVIGE